MNIFRKSRGFFNRRKLIKHNFFEGVYFDDEDKKIKKAILTWICKWESSHNVSITSFLSLFSDVRWLTFPIKVVGYQYPYSGNIELNIIDANAKYYYMELYQCWYMSRSKLKIYEVTERLVADKELFDIVFEYEVKKGEILLKKKHIQPLKQDGTNQSYNVIFEYNKEDDISSVTLKRDLNPHEITISYNKGCNEFESKITKYMFNLIYKNEIYNVFENFVDIIQIFKTDNSSKSYYLSVKSCKESDVLSEIIVKNDIVLNYSYTETSLNDVEKGYYQFILNGNIKDFISKHAK